MSEFNLGDGGYKARRPGSEVERDGLVQSMMGYYGSGPNHGPDPDPAGYEADYELPRGDKVRVAALVVVSFAFFILHWQGQI